VSGTVANPVSLDPFRTIVEVGWNAEKFIAFPLLIQRRSVVKDYPFPEMAIGETGQTEQPVDWTADIESAPVSGPNVSSSYYVTGFQYEYALGETPGPGYNGYVRLASGGWTPKPIETFAGLPSLPDVHSVGAWTVMFTIYGTTDTVLSWWPRAEYQPISGSPLGIAVPTNPEVGFVSAGPAALQMRGAAISGPSQGVLDNLAKLSPSTNVDQYLKTGTTGTLDPATGDGMDFVFAELDIDVASISITRNGKTYAAIGMALVPPPAIAPTSPGALWILG